MIEFYIWKEKKEFCVNKKLTYRQGLIKDLNKVVYIVGEDFENFFVIDSNTSPVEKILKKDIVFA
jgi:hypothetical protein